MRTAELRTRDTVLVRIDGQERSAVVRGLFRTPRPGQRTHVLVVVDFVRGARNIRLHPRLILRRVGHSGVRGRGLRGTDAQTSQEDR